MMTSGATWKVWPRGGGARRWATRSAILISPFSARSIAAAIRSARRSSSSSRSKARETEIVSRTSPSVVVKIWASTMLPPEAAQAPVLKLDGVLQESIYIGTDRRYQVRLDSGETVYVRIQNSGRHIPSIANGDRCSLYVCTSDIRVLTE